MHYRRFTQIAAKKMRTQTTSGTALDQTQVGSPPNSTAVPSFDSGSGFKLSLQSKLQLQSVSEHLDWNHSALESIRAEIDNLRKDPGNREILKRLARHLSAFSMEADSWGFDAQTRVAHGMHQLILTSGSRGSTRVRADLLEEGLCMLSVLTADCEYEFRRRLAIADLLDSFSGSGGH